MRTLIFSILGMVFAMFAFLAPVTDFSSVEAVFAAIEMVHGRSIFWAYVTLVLTLGFITLAKFGDSIVEDLGMLIGLLVPVTAYFSIASTFGFKSHPLGALAVFLVGSFVVNAAAVRLTKRK
jgi:hypothetical protein